MTMNVAAYIAAQRALFDRLEQFARTPEYERLLSALQDFASDDPAPWLADWLISPAFGLSRALPIDVAGAPSGVDRLVAQLLRICRHRAGRTIAAQSTSMYCSGSQVMRWLLPQIQYLRVGSAVDHGALGDCSTRLTKPGRVAA